MTIFKNNRTYFLTVRLSPAEHERFRQLAGKALQKGMSAYARSVLLRQPVRIRYRNQSADDILAVLLAIKNDLESICEHLEEAGKKLRTATGNDELKTWAAVYDYTRTEALQQVAETRKKMNLIYDKWLPE